MKLSIENVGMLSKVDLNINGITVIAGENDSGKSTISKSLYTMFNGLYELDEKILNIKVMNIRKNINDFLKRNFNLHFTGQYIKENMISELLKNNDIDKKIIKNILIETVELTLRNDNIISRKKIDIIKNIEQEKFDTGISLDELKKKIDDAILMDEMVITNSLLKDDFNKEFSNQINNINTNEEGNITLSIKNMDTKVNIKENKINLKTMKNIVRIYTRAIYIDDPLILDKESDKNFPYSMSLENNNFHSDNLMYDLQKKSELDTIEKIQTDEKITNIFSKINKEGIGQLIFEEDIFKLSIMYKPKKGNKALNIKNVSAGLKSFLIIKTLLENGALQEKGVLILDEPEVHLHPEWQVLFAELVVLLQKEFNMHILLTTHSPYFLFAIELFSKKYKIKEKCKFYFSKKENEIATLIDMTDNIEPIFKSLSNPFFKLEDMEIKMEEESCGR